MPVTRPSALFATFLGLVVSVALMATAFQEETKAGARFVPIEIRLDDQVVWEGNVSDDGHANVDEVWNRLMKAPLRRGPDFEANASKIHDDGDTATLEGTITVDVRYGGVITVRELTLHRTTTDKGDRWTLPAEFVERSFWNRLVKRRSAESLRGQPERPNQ